LGQIREQSCVVICLVDMFDLHGSLLPDLREIAGNNPVLVAANKIDLFPTDVPHERLQNWVFKEVKETCGFLSPTEKKDFYAKEWKSRGWLKHSDEKTPDAGVLLRKNVHLISCTTGHGMQSLFNTAHTLAGTHGNKIYVMGAANVGKSSFINRLLDNAKGVEGGAKKKGGKRYSGGRSGGNSSDGSNVKKDVASATVSNLPGTTLNFLKIVLPNGVVMYDTPGLLKPGQLTAKLTKEELSDVIPSTPVVPVTFRMLEGKTMLVGGLATVELLEVRIGVIMT
jgi:30S ribosome assembly GTPase